MSKLINAICPRCEGNGFIRVQDLLGEDIDQADCPQCDSQGEVELPIEIDFCKFWWWQRINHKESWGKKWNTLKLFS